MYIYIKINDCWWIGCSTATRATAVAMRGAAGLLLECSDWPNSLAENLRRSHLKPQVQTLQANAACKVWHFFWSKFHNAGPLVEIQNMGCGCEAKSKFVVCAAWNKCGIKYARRCQETPLPIYYILIYFIIGHPSFNEQGCIVADAISYFHSSHHTHCHTLSCVTWRSTTMFICFNWTTRTKHCKSSLPW